MKNNVKEFKGCLMGVAIGDALGMPVETMSAKKILDATDGKGVSTFVDPIQRRIAQMAALKAGQTTDDWQLTKAVAESLIKSGGRFDLEICAREHIRTLEGSSFGWGDTTEKAIRALMADFSLLGKPLVQVPGGGCGNGVVMKVAPLALAHYTYSIYDAYGAYDPKKLWKDVRALGTMTHPDLNASVSAFAVALMLVLVLKESVLTKEGAWVAFTLVRSTVIEIEAMEREAAKPEDNYKPVVSEILRKTDDCIRDDGDLVKTIGSGFYAPVTAAFCLGMFLKHFDDFRTGVLAAINAGGDTDTNGAVVGSLIGANVGLDGIPAEWQSFNPEFWQAIPLGSYLRFVNFANKVDFTDEQLESLNKLGAE